MKLKAIAILLLIQPVAMADHGSLSIEKENVFDPNAWCYKQVEMQWDKEDNYTYDPERSLFNDPTSGRGSGIYDNPYLLVNKPDSPQADYEHCLRIRQEEKRSKDWFKANKPVG